MEVPVAGSRDLRCQKPGCQNGSQRLSSESASQHCSPCSTWRVCGRRRSHVYNDLPESAGVLGEGKAEHGLLSSSFSAFQLRCVWQREEHGPGSRITFSDQLEPKCHLPTSPPLHRATAAVCFRLKDTILLTNTGLTNGRDVLKLQAIGLFLRRER